MRTSKRIGLWRRFVAAIALASGSAVASAAGLAEPRRSRWWCRSARAARPTGSAGSPPIICRKAFKQQFYIENRVGAGGAVASTQVARADADGYTLLIGGSGPHIMGPAENPNIGYDPVGDFTHIAMIGGESYALSAQASLGVKSFKELIALSKSKTGADQLSARPARARSASSWSSRCSCSKIANLNHVPYRGGAPLLTDFFGKVQRRIVFEN